MRKIFILTKKEITEILRDKKTLVIMIVMPLILYPMLLIGMTVGMSLFTQSQLDKTYTISYDTEDKAYIDLLTDIYDENIDDLDYMLEFIPDAAEEADASVRFSKEDGTVHVSVEYTSTDNNSDCAQQGLSELVDLYKEQLLLTNLENEGLTQDFLKPLVYEGLDTASVSESLGMSIGGSIGMMLMVMIMMGAFYPAVDVTTGEKERGTLETLLTLPVTNFQMIVSKYISVSIMACVTAIISILALGGSVLFMMFGLPSEYIGEIGTMPVGTFLAAIPILLLAVIATALLITAISMCFCIFAKSSKEANNYMTPVMLVVMIASMAGVIPSVNLDYRTSLIPLVNVSLLVKQVLAQQLNYYLAGITILVNAMCSIIVIWIIARIYNSEDVLFNEGFNSFRLFQKRSDMKKGTVPATGDIIMCLAVVLILMVYISVIVGTRSVFGATVVTQLMIMATPLLVTWYMKSDVKKLFCLKRSDARKSLVCILIYIGTFILVNILSVALTQIFSESTENIELLYSEFLEQPFPILVLVMAFMPAIGEELLFRGLVLGSLKDKYGARTAIIVSAIIFGAYHTSLVKFIPTMLLGLCLAFSVEYTGSIYISMLLHFLNNYISVIGMKLM